MRPINRRGDKRFARSRLGAKTPPWPSATNVARAAGAVEHRQVGFRGSEARRRRSVAASLGAARDSGLAMLGALAGTTGSGHGGPGSTQQRRQQAQIAQIDAGHCRGKREEEQGERPPSPASAHAGAAACWVRPWGPPAPSHSCAEGSSRPALPHRRA